MKKRTITNKIENKKKFSYKYLEHINEKESELKELFKKLSFYILLEIFFFTESAQEMDIKEKNENTINFLFKHENREEDLLLITQKYDKESKKISTKISLSYIKYIFGYFKNDKFRKHFQLIRSFKFYFRKEYYHSNPIEISSLIPSFKKVFELKFSSSNISDDNYNSPLVIIFDETKDNKFYAVKKISLDGNIKLSTPQTGSINKLLEKVKCEEFFFDSIDYFNEKSNENIMLSSVLKNLKAINVSEKFNIFHFHENFSNLTFIKFSRFDIIKKDIDFMLMYVKKLKKLQLNWVSIDLFDLLTFLKDSKIKKLHTSNTEYDDPSQFQDIKNEKKNIDKFKNSTLEYLTINADNDLFSILHLIFNNLKYFETRTLRKYALEISKLNLEKADFNVIPKLNLIKFLENTDMKKLKELSIFFSFKEFAEEIKNFPKLTSFTIRKNIWTHTELTNNEILTPKFLDFIKNCKVKEFNIVMRIIQKWEQYSEFKKKNFIELLYNAFNENQYMKSFQLILPSFINNKDGIPIPVNKYENFFFRK